MNINFIDVVFLFINYSNFYKAMRILNNEASDEVFGF